MPIIYKLVYDLLETCKYGINNRLAYSHAYTRKTTKCLHLSLYRIRQSDHEMLELSCYEGHILTNTWKYGQLTIDLLLEFSVCFYSKNDWRKAVSEIAYNYLISIWRQVVTCVSAVQSYFHGLFYSSLYFTNDNEYT